MNPNQPRDFPTLPDLLKPKGGSLVEKRISTAALADTLEKKSDSGQENLLLELLRLEAQETDEVAYGRMALVRIDLSAPLERQLDKSKKLLITEQKKRLGSLSKFQLDGESRKNWPRCLRVIDGKDQNASHDQIYARFASEASRGSERAMDEFYRPNKQPRSSVSQWLKQAREVMDKAIRFL